MKHLTVASPCPPRTKPGRLYADSAAGTLVSVLYETPGPSGMLFSPLVNDRLGRLSDYPFTRLASLLAGTTPRANIPPIIMSVGEPQHAPPALIDETLRGHAHLWGKYPPVAGTPEFRASVVRWLKRRYDIPDRLVDAERMILPLAGTREGL